MAKKDIKCIILATFESLNIGLGYALLPLLLNDKNLILNYLKIIIHDN